jgi:HSP20 family protein
MPQEVEKTSSKQPEAQRRGMSLSPFLGSPFMAMRRIHEDIDRMFEQAFGGLGGGLMSWPGGGQQQEGGGSAWMPAIEVRRKDGQLTVCAELPGLKPEEVQVELENDELIIRGERRQEETKSEDGVHRTERRYGRFYRAIPLPEGADTEQVKAQFRNGLLEVTVPVSGKSGRRQIPISSGGSSEKGR